MKRARASLTGLPHIPEDTPGITEHASGGTSRNTGEFPSQEPWTPARVRAVMWRGLTIITCPCCIPIWLAVLSGTVIGALLSKNIFITVALFLALFAVSFWKALRSYDRPSVSTPEGDQDEPR